MATHLVTGYAGSEHIKSEDQGSFNASFFGTGQFVMEAGNQLEASIIDNNTVRILDGDILMKGRHIRVNPDTYEDMIIENGTAGVNRCDLIVMEYSKVPETGIETATLKVLKGTATSGTASAPSYTDGDILTGAILNQMPLYKVLIEGVVLVDVVSLFDTIPTFQTLAEMYRAKFIKDCETHLNSLGILDTMEEVNANTQDNQLAGAKAVKELGEDLSGMNKNFYKVDLNTITYKTSGYCNECFNVPEGAGSGYIEVIPVGDGGSSLVLQRYTMYNSRIVWIRQKVVGGSWTKWIDPLAYYLPLTGGTITGALIVNSYIKQGKYLVPSCSATTFIMGVYEFEQEFGTGSTPTSYGMIIIHGNSRPGSWVDDTYYHIIDSDGNSYNGRQTGGATAITWDRHLTVNDFVITGTEDDATLTINLD